MKMNRRKVKTRNVVEIILVGDDGKKIKIKKKVKYDVDKNIESLPTFNLKVIGLKRIGKHKGYDIQITKNETFLANGLVTHNCLDGSTLISIGNGFSRQIRFYSSRIFNFIT